VGRPARPPRAEWPGYALAAGFVVLSAGRDTGVQARPLAVSFLLLAAFLPAALVAAAVARRGLVPRRPRAALYLLALNASTLLNWTGYLLSLQGVNAVLVAAVVVGFMPVWMLALEWAFDRRVVSRRDLLAAGLVAGSVGLLALDQPTPPPAAGPAVSSPVGLGLAVLASLFAATNNWLVGRLKTLGVGPLPAFAGRFWLLLAVAAAWALADRGAGVPADPGDWAFAGLLGLFGVAVPLLALHGAIGRLGPARATLFIAFHPAVVQVLLLVGWAIGGGPDPPGWAGWVGLVGVTAGIGWGLRQPRTYRPRPGPPPDLGA
jgi:drug/metabolite transporter (DMT)-like permease